MAELDQSAPSRSAPFVTAWGSLTGLSAANRARLSAFLVKGAEVLGETRMTAGGRFQFRIARQLVRKADIFVVLGPCGLDAQALVGRADLPRIALANAGHMRVWGSSGGHCAASSPGDLGARRGTLCYLRPASVLAASGHVPTQPTDRRGEQ